MPTSRLLVSPVLRSSEGKKPREAVLYHQLISGYACAVAPSTRKKRQQIRSNKIEIFSGKCELSKQCQNVLEVLLIILMHRSTSYEFADPKFNKGLG